jgi:hypothetical protein
MVRRLIKQWFGAMTTVQRNNIPSSELYPGDQIWNLTAGELQVWNGIKWISVGAGGFIVPSKSINFYDDFIYPDFRLNSVDINNFRWKGENGAGEVLQIEDPEVNGALHMSTPNSFAGPYLTLPPQTVKGIKKSWSLYSRFKSVVKINAVYCTGLADSVTRFYIGNSFCILISYFQSVIPNNFCLITQIDPFIAYFYDTGIFNDDTYHEWRLDADSVNTTLKLYHKNKITDEWDLVVTVGNPAEIPLIADMKLSIYVGDQNAVPPASTDTWTDVINFEVDRDLS